MPKKRVAGTKASAIREALAEHPKASGKEIVAALAARGLKVSTAHVYLVKSATKRKARRVKRRRAIEATEKIGMANPIELIVDLKAFAERAGGMKHLKRLVDVLAE